MSAHIVRAILAKEFGSAAESTSTVSTTSLTFDVQRLLLGDLRLQSRNRLLLLLNCQLKLNTVDATVALDALLRKLQLLNGIQEIVE